MKTFQARRWARQLSWTVVAGTLLAGCSAGPGSGPGTTGAPTTGAATTGSPTTETPTTGTPGPASGPAGKPTADGNRDYTDARLQALLRGVKLDGIGQLQADDPRAVASGALGDYHDASDPKRGAAPGKCELFDSYLMFNAANGSLASGLLIPSTPGDQDAMKMTGTYRSLSAVHPASSTGRSEFQQRRDAYGSCNTVREISLLPGKLQMDIVRLSAKVDGEQSFAVSQLTSDGARVGAIYVGGSKSGVDVIYRQTVNGNAAQTLDADAAARQGADVVNQVLSRLP